MIIIESLSSFNFEQAGEGDLYMLDSLIKDGQDYLFKNLLKQWLKHGLHPELGYSYESLNHDWSVNPVGRIRLLTQCRQLYTFSHAYVETQDEQWLSPLKPLFEFILTHYWIGEAWIFSLNDDLTVKDQHSDCYALAFVLLSFSYYFEATKDKRALKFIEYTHQFLQQKMACENGGFLEKFPKPKDRVRRQNPHMHLLEGYLAAYNATNSSAYREEIKKLLNLTTAHFFDSSSNSLIEFFHYDWSVHETLGESIEPGHHFEWVWLLHQANNIFPDQHYLDIADSLWKKACDYGFDSKGGVYNQIHAKTGKVLDAEKRIWPITEYLKALCAHKPENPETQKHLVSSLEFLFKHYLMKDGSWNEYLDAQNLAKSYPLPGTTSYHIFLGLIEVVRWSKAKL